MIAAIAALETADVLVPHDSDDASADAALRFVEETLGLISFDLRLRLRATVQKIERKIS
jgi:hypothetical protein